jgi:hypothetical protein
MSKKERLRHCWRSGNSDAATYTVSLSIGIATLWSINPDVVLDNTETQMRLLALGYLGWYLLFMSLGFLVAWWRTNPARPVPH